MNGGRGEPLGKMELGERSGNVSDSEAEQAIVELFADYGDDADFERVPMSGSRRRSMCAA